MTVVVRDFVAGDQERVRELVLAGLGEHWGRVDPSLNPDLDDIARSYGHGRTVVVELDGVIAATGTVVPGAGGDAEIVRMSVDAPARGRGLGRLVVDELLVTARSWGCPRVVLETTAAWDDVVAFYLSCGFSITHHADGEFGRDAWFERRI